MAVNSELYSELAKALSQPSKAYRAATEAVGIPGSFVKGYTDITTAKNAIQEAKLKPYEIYSKIAESASPEIASKIFNAQGIPVPDMTSQGGQSLEDMGSQFEKDPMSFNSKTRTMLATARNQGASNDIRQQIADALSDRNTQVSFIGNDKDGNPLVMDKHGNVTRAKVPALPTSPDGEPPKPFSPGGPVLPKGSTLPTSPTRSSGEFAHSLIPHIQGMRDLIAKADAKGLLGPASGRLYVDFLAGKVGSTGDADLDKLLGELKSVDSLTKSGTLKVHFGSRGGSQMFDHFSDILNSGKMSAASMNGSLNGIESYLKGYEQAGNTGQYQGPESPDSFGGKSFGSEQEAEASGYKGPALIGGKRAIIH